MRIHDNCRRAPLKSPKVLKGERGVVRGVAPLGAALRTRSDALRHFPGGLSPLDAHTVTRSAVCGMTRYP